MMSIITLFIIDYTRFCGIQHAIQELFLFLFLIKRVGGGQPTVTTLYKRDHGSTCSLEIDLTSLGHQYFPRQLINRVKST
jgi:hypothetical protein